MATRVIKSGSTSVEFGASPQPWHIADLDADLDAIFSDVDASNLANGAVTTPKLANGAVTLPILPVGVTAASQGSGAVSTGLTFSTVETVVVTLSGMTTRGGPVLLLGTIAWVYLIPGSADTLKVRLKRDAVAIAEFDYKVGIGTTNLAIPTPTFVDIPPAGAHVYTVSGQTVLGGAGITTPSNNAGSYFAVELA